MNSESFLRDFFGVPAKSVAVGLNIEKFCKELIHANRRIEKSARPQWRHEFRYKKRHYKVVITLEVVNE